MWSRKIHGTVFRLDVFKFERVLDHFRRDLLCCSQVPLSLKYSITYRKIEAIIIKMFQASITKMYKHVQFVNIYN